MFLYAVVKWLFEFAFVGLKGLAMPPYKVINFGISCFAAFLLEIDSNGVIK